MIRIMLVDDDSFFHTIFRELVDWESLGCTIVQQAENGQQAISMLMQTPVDVLITDMVMPGISGVELISYVRKEYPQIKCVALSSFDDFNLVRQSLKEGAHDYLLKHTLNRDSITSLLSSLSLTQQSSEKVSDQGVFSEIFLVMVQGDAPDSTLLSQTLIDLQVHFPNPPMLTVVIRIRDITAVLKRYDTRDQFLRFLSVARNIVQNTLENYGDAFCVSDNYNTFYAVVSNERLSSRAYANQVVHILSNNLDSVMNRYCNIYVITAIDYTCASIDEVVSSIKRLAEQIDLKHNEGYLSSGDENNISVVSIKTAAVQNLAFRMRESSCFDEVQSIIDEEFDSCCLQSPNKQSIQHLCTEFLNLLNRICQDQDVRFEALFPADTSPYMIVSRMNAYSEMREFVSNAYQKLFDTIHASEVSGNVLVQSAKRIIHKRYNEDISLASIADAIHCNPAYLSRAFKAETGTRFVDYLNDFRIKQAQELMRSQSCSLHQIAIRVGFTNYNYFFRVFKQRTGMTPQSYIKQSLAIGVLPPTL